MSNRSAHENGGASVDFHMWATGIPGSSRSKPTANRTPDAVQEWEPQPGAWFDSYQLIGSTIEHSMRTQDNWRLAEMGKGAITLQAKNAGGGLVVSLLSWHHSDLNGYHIVLDDDKHESYVLKLSKIGNNGLLKERMDGGVVSGRREYVRVPGVVADPTFRLNPHQQSLWVIYQHGAIVVGQGTTPGAGPVVLHMVPEPVKHRGEGRELYHFGFSRFGSRWDIPITVHDVKSYRYARAQLIPLPAKPIFAANASVQPIDVANPGGMLYRGLASHNSEIPPPRPNTKLTVPWGDRTEMLEGPAKYHGQI